MLNKNTTALALGLFIGFVHLVRALAIAIFPSGMQMLMDRIFTLHFLKPLFVITEASLLNGVLLVLFTFIVGYVFGRVFAFGWNMCYKKR